MQNHTLFLLLLWLVAGYSYGCVTAPIETPPPTPAATPAAPPVKATPPAIKPVLSKLEATKLTPAALVWLVANPNNQHIPINVLLSKTTDDPSTFTSQGLTVDGPLLTGHVTRKTLIALAKNPNVATIENQGILLKQNPTVADWSNKLSTPELSMWLLGISPRDIALPTQGDNVVLSASFTYSLTADEQAYFNTLGLRKFQSKFPPKGMGDPKKGRPENITPRTRKPRNGQGFGIDTDFTMATGAIDRNALRTLLTDHRLFGVVIDTGETPPEQIDLRALENSVPRTIGGPKVKEGRFIRIDDPNTPDPNRPKVSDVPPLEDDKP